MHSKISSALMLLVGLVNFAPLIGIVSVSQLESIYAVELADGNLQILMLHRALLFGLVGGFIIGSVFRPGLQPIAMVLAFISMAGFIAIAFITGGYNEQLEKLMMIDAIALVLLLLAAVIRFRTNK